MSLQERAAALTDPTFFAEPSRVNALFAELRRDMPVCYVEPEGFRPVWLITKHRDIEYIGQNSPELFISGGASLVVLPISQEINHSDLHTLVHMDGDIHRKYRQITQSWFMPKSLDRLKETVASYAKQYVSSMEQKAPACDFASEVAFWYPLRIIMSLLGVPPEDDAKIIRFTQEFIGYQDPDIAGDRELTFKGGIKPIFEYFVPIVEEKRRNPGDDLASVVANAEINGKLLEMTEVLSYFLTLATAGHDTTSASLAGGLEALIEHPDQMQMLRDNPELLPGAIEEMIRWVAPVKHFVRTTTKDVEIRGQKIPAGSSLMLLYPSACRDEEIFSDGDRFDITRKPNKHMAFGFGPHMCLGKYLAKMELEAFFRELLPRLKSVEFNGAAKTLASNTICGLKSLPLRYSF